MSSNNVKSDTSLTDAVRQEKELQARLRAVDVESWYDALVDHTFKSIFVELSPNEARAMIASYRAKKSNTQLTTSNTDTLNKLQNKIDDAMQKLGGVVFAKLSSRSPKDSTFAQQRAFKMVCDKLLQRRQEGLSVTANDVASTIMSATIESLRYTSAADVIECFCTSDRVCEDDLPLALEFPGQWNQHIVVREFVHIPTQNEFRAFVMNGQLTALTQYFDGAYYPELVANRETIGNVVHKFFDRVRDKINIKPAEYSMDLAVDFAKDEVKIVEFNPFGRPNGLGTGTVLFNNRDDTDLQVLFGERPFECRVVTKPTYADFAALNLRGELKDWLITNKFF